MYDVYRDVDSFLIRDLTKEPVYGEIYYEWFSLNEITEECVCYIREELNLVWEDAFNKELNNTEFLIKCSKLEDLVNYLRTLFLLGT